MNRRYILIGVEGNHDQAFVAKILRQLFGFSKFKGKESNLDPVWRKFIPQYPKSGNLYKRLDMPSILETEILSVAIYVGEGSNLIQNLSDKFTDIDYTFLDAFAIITEADKSTPSTIAEIYHNGFQKIFRDFPAKDQMGTVTKSIPRLGLYVLPNNLDQGVLETLLLQCGEVAYPDYMKRAGAYINEFSEEEIKQMRWKPFDREKAIIATVVSVLKPGKTNTVSIDDNLWICSQTEHQIPQLQNFIHFLKKLLDIT